MKKNQTLEQLRNQIGDWAFVRYLRNCEIPLTITLRIMFGPGYQIRHNMRYSLGEM